VNARHGNQPTFWARTALENAQHIDAIYISAIFEEELIGCGVLVGDQGFYRMTLLGLNYKFRGLYFKMIYSAIRAGINANASCLYIGSGAGGAEMFKKRLGFEHNMPTASVYYDPQYIWLKWSVGVVEKLGWIN
jgi:hypothetical protein